MSVEFSLGGNKDQKPNALRLAFESGLLGPTISKEKVEKDIKYAQVILAANAERGKNGKA